MTQPSRVRVEEMQELGSPPGTFVSVYITAKLIHSTMLVDLRKNWPKLYFTARWPLTAHLPSEQAKPASLWTRDNEDDIKRADVVLGYAHPDDRLKAALTELGYAHAHGKAIYLAGPTEAFGDYAYCSSVVKRTERLEIALQTISDRLNYVPHAEAIGTQLARIENILTTLTQPQ
jgi:hypothetical protein